MEKRIDYHFQESLVSRQNRAEHARRKQPF